MDLAQIKTFLIDGDGVLWRGDKAIPGLARFMDVLAARDMRWALLTNNNTRTVGDYITKLAGFGVPVDAGIIFSSSTVTADYLRERYGYGAPVHAVGMRGLTETLADAGFTLTHGEKAPQHEVVAVAAGMDRTITHEKIQIAMRLILAGAEFVATNTDGTYPTPEGLAPGTGMVIGALQATTGVTPVIIGKPQRAIFDQAMKALGADPATTAMIGDRLNTDILGGQRAGIATIGVLTGVTSPEQMAASPVRPDLIFDSIAGITRLLEEAPMPA